MAEVKKLPGLLYDKSTGWWYTIVKDPSKKCGRAKIAWSNDKNKARQLYKKDIEKVVAEHADKEPEVVQILDARSWSLVEMAAHYYDVKKADGCSALFLNAVKHHIQKFMDWLTEHGFDVSKKTAAELSSALLASYRQNLAEDKTLALKTANHYISYVRMLLLWGSKMHGILHPPIGAMSQFSTRRNAKAGHGRKQDRTPLTWEELEKLLKAADVTDSALLMLGLNCGFGNSDIGTLKLCDVDLENGTISHPRPKTKVERDFTLWPETIDVLKQYLEKERGKPRNDEIAKLFFVTLKGCPFSWTVLDKKGKLQRSDAVGNRFDRVCERAGIKRKYGAGFYILRHTYATFIGEQSCDYRELQAALGQLTLQQQEAYRHDRKTKAYSAQQRLRGTMHHSSIPKILSDKLNGIENSEMVLAEAVS